MGVNWQALAPVEEADLQEILGDNSFEMAKGGLAGEEVADEFRVFEI